MRRPTKGVIMPMEAASVRETFISVRDHPNSSSSGMINAPNANWAAPMDTPMVRKVVAAIGHPR
jgi:hypothetical protein